MNTKSPISIGGYNKAGEMALPRGLEPLFPA